MEKQRNFDELMKIGMNLIDDSDDLEVEELREIAFEKPLEAVSKAFYSGYAISQEKIKALQKQLSDLEAEADDRYLVSECYRLKTELIEKILRFYASQETKNQLDYLLILVDTFQKKN